MLHEFQSFEYICKFITLNDGLQYCILCVYRPPSYDAHSFLSDFNALLDELSSAYPQCDRWIVGGDFNINLLAATSQSDAFITTLMCFSLFPTVFLPTRPTSQSLIDNIFLSWPGFIDSHVLTVDISDHFPIITRANLSARNMVFMPIAQGHRRFTAAAVSSFRFRLSNCNWDSVFACDDVDSALTAFNTILQVHFRLAFPTIDDHCAQSHSARSHSSPKKPWITPAILISSRTRSACIVIS
jgi:hypothetical protein